MQEHDFTGNVFFVHLSYLKMHPQICKTLVGSRMMYSAVHISSASPLDVTIYIFKYCDKCACVNMHLYFK